MGPRDFCTDMLLLLKKILYNFVRNMVVIFPRGQVYFIIGSPDNTSEFFLNWPFGAHYSIALMTVHLFNEKSENQWFPDNRVLDLCYASTKCQTNVKRQTKPWGKMVWYVPPQSNIKDIIVIDISFPGVLSQLHSLITLSRTFWIKRASMIRRMLMWFVLENRKRKWACSALIKLLFQQEARRVGKGTLF